ncbi:unnamed protein product, partial [Meganyctiphanes norvegica]
IFQLCEIPDGVIVKKSLSDDEKRNFMKQSGGSSTIVNERLRKTERILKEQNYNNSSPTVKSLQMTISEKPVETDGRVLPTTMLQMKNKGMTDCDIEPCEGEWNPRNHIFFHPAKLTSWAVFNYSRLLKQDQVMMFVKKLTKMAKERGCEMNLP